MLKTIGSGKVRGTGTKSVDPKIKHQKILIKPKIIHEEKKAEEKKSPSHVKQHQAKAPPLNMKKVQLNDKESAHGGS